MTTLDADHDHTTPAADRNVDPQHAHVVLDQAVFLAYHDASEAARDLADALPSDPSSPTAGYQRRLNRYLDALDAATARSLVWNAADPGHHEWRQTRRRSWTLRWRAFRAWMRDEA